MAQPPYKAPPPPAKPNDQAKAHEAKGKDQHVPLKDPSEGKSPAVIGRDVAARDAREGEEPAGYGPTIGVRGLPIEDGERDPDTIAEEQRRRSAEMEAMGMAAWIEAHDERSAEDKGQVASTKRLEAEKHP